MPLHWAARQGQERLFQMIMDKKPEMNKTNGEGLAALHYAVMEGHQNIVDMLVNVKGIKLVGGGVLYSQCSSSIECGG